MNPELPNLHDAVLEGIEIDWQSATTTIRFGLPGDPPPSRNLVFGGVRVIHIPRDQPWGPSVFVNTIEYADGLAADDVSVRLEMQSGDEITVRAASLDIS
jgi:hypothetical protein